MSTLVRHSNPLSEMLDWLQSETSLSLGNAAHYIRVEDFTEDGNYIVRAEVTATYNDGVVEVRVPISEQKHEVTKIPVQRSNSSAF